MKNTFVIILLLAGLSFFSTVQAQSVQEQKKQERAERKQRENKQQEENARRLLSLVKDKNFVLEAHTVYDARQSSYPVSPSTNFVAVSGDNATIQLAFNGGIGRNGLGGITIDGRISSYEVKHKGKGPVSVYAQVSSTALGNATLSLRIYDNGTARASIRGSFGSEVAFAGNLVNFSNTTVYKGTPSF